MRNKNYCHGKKLFAGLLAATMLATTAQIPEAEVQAAGQSGQTLTVDLTATTGDIVHGASGFLYGISPRYVKYRFQVEPGSYSVVVGMGCNSWDNAHNPDIYIGETGNVQADTKLNTGALNIPKDSNMEVQGTVTVQGQDLYVYALSQDDTLQMNYIYVEKAGNRN